MVAISLGDPSGIGPEIVDRALARPKLARALSPLVFGDGPTLEAHPTLRRLLRSGRAVAVTQLRAKDRRPGRPSTEGGRAQHAFILAAIDAAKRGVAQAICTAPVSKEQISRAGIPFMGHTEVLAEAFGVEVLMLMAGPRLKVALATNHLPLAQVPKALSQERLTAQLLLLSRSLRPWLGRRPKLAVCGLNPHAGEGGLLGREEVELISPAIAQARRRGVDCTGPYAADGLFARLHEARFDAALAMFHDQGLVAAKALDFERTVNVTLGLPVPRTSPDHGVAYPLAKTGGADDTPMAEALLLAAKLCG